MRECLGRVGLATLFSEDVANWTLGMTIQPKVDPVVVGPLHLSQTWPAYFLHNPGLPVNPHDNNLDHVILSSVVQLRELRLVEGRQSTLVGG